jgi:DNA primase
MFPIRDRRGRTLGFGGRAMRSDQGAKYVNTAETDFFHKSKMLYGIDRAKSAIAGAGRAIVVEGYTDVLALHQAGIEEATGVMGTAITGDQVAALSGMVEEVVLALDADAAGQEAMLRAQRVAAGRRMRIRVAAMPDGEDPAEMIAAEGGAERFRALVDGAVELPVFQVGLVLDRTDPSSPSERDRALGEAAPIIAAMGETASRDDLVRRVAERLDLEPAMVMGRVTVARPVSGGGAEEQPDPRGAPPAPRRNTAELTSRERRERALLAMCIALPAEGGEYMEKLTGEHLSALGARAHAWLREHPEEPASDLPRDDPELAGLIAELVILASEEPASAEAMELNFMLLEQRRLEAEISAAWEADDFGRRAALSRERAALVERIARTERVG